MLFEPFVRLNILSSVLVTEWPPLGNSWSLGLRYVFLVYVRKCHFSFSNPRFIEWEYLSDCAIS